MTYLDVRWRLKQFEQSVPRVPPDVPVVNDVFDVVLRVGVGPSHSRW